MLNVSFKFLLLLCFILINPLLGTPLLKLEKEIHYLYNNCFYYIGNVNTHKNISWKNCRDIRKKVLNFGYKKEPVWIKFTVENHNPDLNIYFIKLSTSALDSLQVYINSNLMEVCGDHYDYHSRNIPTNECYYKFYINYKEKKDIILKYQSTSNILIPVVFYSEKEFIKNQYYSSFLHGAIIGSFVILFIYHLFFSISSRIKYFYYFSIYIFVTTCLSYSLINGRSLFFNFIPYYIFDKANAFFAFLTSLFCFNIYI
ncbi:MAG: hypothetical protein KatS3mg129_0208 [Leptospiraceae bacterium]|nr:MAG: hypothetical protein KatS3mg129_0208 [Leptospiraceae bacterium]